MLQETVLRMGQADGFTAPIVVAADNHRFFAAEQLQQLGLGSAGLEAARIILEPSGRNTAPAATLAALEVKERLGGETLMLVAPADHVVTDPHAFRLAVHQAAATAATGNLVTFGITPTGPETGYGYIRAGGSLSNGLYELAKFVEKPDLKTAKSYLESGNYYWNSGIFLFSADRWLEAMQTYAAEMLAACRDAWGGRQTDLDFIRVDPVAFERSPSDSIDYAVMEHTDRGAVLPVDCGWSDVGSWAALADVSPKDQNGNAVQGDVQLLNTENCLIQSRHRLVAAVGLKNLVVVETADAVLVADRDQSQAVKDIVANLKSAGREVAVTHRRVHRPWGWYESVDECDRFKVKRIQVKPGASLSLQRHQRRAEHWVVVRGVGRVTRGDEVFELNVDQSTYIPVTEIHRLENPGTEPLEIIEVQTGDYLGEDDIERLEDSYGRVD